MSGESQEEKAELEQQAQKPREQRIELAEKRTEMAEERSHMAEERTDWAEHRTLLANERNFSAWIRTGLSAMAGGLAVAQLLGEEETGVLARSAGVILVAMGAGVCAVAFWRYNQITEVLKEEGLPITPKWAAGLLVGGLLVIAILVLILIFSQ